MSRTLRSLFCISWAGLLLSGCAALGPTYTAAPEAPKGKATIYVYRESGFVGGGVAYTVNANGIPVSTLPSGGYFVYYATPGEVELSAKTEASTSVTVDAKAGETYYVKGTVGVGVFVGHPHLVLVSREIGAKEIAACKLVPASATAQVTPAWTGGEAQTQFQQGQSKLEHSMGKAASAGTAERTLDSLYRLGRWDELAAEVTRVGYADNKSWYYLGRAAEGSGYFEAAQTYYAESSKAGHCILNTCGKLKFPQVVDERAAGLKDARDKAASWSAAERHRYLTGGLLVHVSFYECRDWADGRPVNELNGELQGVASALEAAAQGADGANAGAAKPGDAGTPNAPTMNVYQVVQFPKDKAAAAAPDRLFDQCMAVNGLQSAGNHHNETTWTSADASYPDKLR